MADFCIGRMPLVNNDVYLELARIDFNHCQALHQLEWQGLKKYVCMLLYIYSRLLSIFFLFYFFRDYHFFSIQNKYAQIIIYILDDI